jgi:methylmalonyl-CoA mutase cobalamin-binding domain/chain
MELCLQNNPASSAAEWLGVRMTLVPRVIELLRTNDANDVLATVGGTIPQADATVLKELGVAEVFTPGTPTDAIVAFIRDAARTPSPLGTSSR